MNILLNTMFTRFYNMYYRSGEKSDAQYTAVLLIGLLLTINVNAIVLFFQLLYFPEVLYSYYWVFALFIVLLMICYFVFIHKSKYKEIVDREKYKGKSRKKIEWLLIGVYIAFSMFVWIYLANKLRVFHL